MRFFFAACVRLGLRWVPLRLNHQGNHAHRHAPTEPAPSHPTHSIGSPPATTSACSVDPQASAVGAVAGPIQLRRSHSPYPTRGQENGAHQSWSTACCASHVLWAADHVPGPVRVPRTRTSGRDGPSAHGTSAIPGASIPPPQSRTEALRQSTHSDPHASAVAVVETVCGRPVRAATPRCSGGRWPRSTVLHRPGYSTPPPSPGVRGSAVME